MYADLKAAPMTETTLVYSVVFFRLYYGQVLENSLSLRLQRNGLERLTSLYPGVHNGRYPLSGDKELPGDSLYKQTAEDNS